MKKISEEEALKINLFALVKHHKKYCEGKECNISLFQILLLAEKAGICFSEEEKQYFI